MTQFAYSFCMALLHSLWQSALLLLLYFFIAGFTHRNNAPLAKRNFLYIAIVVQIGLFISTCCIYFFDPQGYGILTAAVDSIDSSLASARFITPWIFIAYSAVIIFKMLKAIYTWYQFKIQFSTGLQKPAVELKLFTDQRAHQFGIKKKVKLWLSNSIHTPVTFGYFKPVILLPVALLNHISIKQAETLILHELTHIRTHDYVLNWFLVVTETLFFFNPFISRLCREIKLEREKNCDVSVLSFEYSPALYAETLLQAEKMKQLRPVFQLAAVTRKKQLLQRIQFFTSEKVINQTLRFNIVAPVTGLLLLFLLCTAVLFRSQNGSADLQSDAGLHFIPAHNYIVPNTEFSSPEFSRSITTEPVASAPAKKQQPVVQPPVKNPQATMPTNQQPETAEENAEPINLNYARPATVTENEGSRRIVIREEGSGTATVKVYYLSFEDGKWVLQPEWTLTAREFIPDSSAGKTDSLHNRLRKTYPDQQ